MPRITTELECFERKRPAVPQEDIPYSMMIGRSINGFSVNHTLGPEAEEYRTTAKTIAGHGWSSAFPQ